MLQGLRGIDASDKKAVLSQGNRTMQCVFAYTQ